MASVRQTVSSHRVMTSSARDGRDVIFKTLDLLSNLKQDKTSFVIAQIPWIDDGKYHRCAKGRYPPKFFFITYPLEKSQFF